MYKKIQREFEEKFSSTSSIKELRKFVSNHSLPIKDRSKMNLYNKIIKYLKNKSKQPTLMRFFKKKNKDSKEIKKDFSDIYETVFVKEEYVPFLKSEMILEEDSWNTLKERILFQIK
jgi:hypothetical protein